MPQLANRQHRNKRVALVCSPLKEFKYGEARKHLMLLRWRIQLETMSFRPARSPDLLCEYHKMSTTSPILSECHSGHSGCGKKKVSTADSEQIEIPPLDAIP